MKTIVTVNRDYDNQYSWEHWVDGITHLKPKGCTIYCRKKPSFLELDGVEYFEDVHDIPPCDYVEAKGYSQGDMKGFWIDGGDEVIKEHMKKLYTHKNDYDVTIEWEKDGRKKDMTHEFNGLFLVDWIEFPTDEDIKKAYYDQTGNIHEGEVLFVINV